MACHGRSIAVQSHREFVHFHSLSIPPSKSTLPFSLDDKKIRRSKPRFRSYSRVPTLPTFPAAREPDRKDVTEQPQIYVKARSCPMGCPGNTQADRLP